MKPTYSAILFCLVILILVLLFVPRSVGGNHLESFKEGKCSFGNMLRCPRGGCWNGRTCA